MPLTRKLRKAGGSVALTIPRDFVAAMNLCVGDHVEIEPIDSQRLAIRKARVSPVGISDDRDARYRDSRPGSTAPS